MSEVAPHLLEQTPTRICVIGIGGAGGNAVANMIASNMTGVAFVVANTDAQALNASQCTRRIQLGVELTKGLGAGSQPDIGKAAAEETIAEIEKALDGVQMCFIAAGMGGGTGTGAAPVIGRVARNKNILTIGVVTRPFGFEGLRRARSADAGIKELQQHADTLIVIPNQNLFRIANPETTMKQAFRMADEVLQQGVRSLTDLMVLPGLINLDFADIRSVMSGMGRAIIGTGEASGDNRAIEAAELAVSNPLIDEVMRGASRIIISITGGNDMRLTEIDEAASYIKGLIAPDAEIIWGSSINPHFDERIRISVVATGAEMVDRPSHGNEGINRGISLTPKPRRSSAKAPQEVPFALPLDAPPTVAEEPSGAPSTDSDESTSTMKEGPLNPPLIEDSPLNLGGPTPSSNASLFERMANMARLGNHTKPGGDGEMGLPKEDKIQGRGSKVPRL